MESIQQGRFIFGAFLDMCLKVKTEINFELDKDRVFIFTPAKFSKEDLRILFKIIDLDFPRDKKGIPKSYAELSKSELSKHIEFITSEFYHNGIILE